MDALDLKYLFEDMEENSQYEEYLTTHIGNVKKAYEWLKENLPDVVSEDNCVGEVAYYGNLDEIIAKHDESKYKKVPDRDCYYDTGRSNLRREVHPSCGNFLEYTRGSLCVISTLLAKKSTR